MAKKRPAKKSPSAHSARLASDCCPAADDYCCVNAIYDGMYTKLRRIDLAAIRKVTEQRARPLIETASFFGPEGRGTPVGRARHTLSLMKACFLDAEVARKNGDSAGVEHALFAAGILYGQWCVDEPRWRGEELGWRLADRAKANQSAKQKRQQDAIAELHARWKKSPGLTRDAIIQAMAEEAKWGSIHTLRKYLRGEKSA